MIPVTINLTPDTFNRLERVAADKGMRLRDLIAAGLEPKPIAPVAGYVAAPKRSGYIQLTDAEWAEIKRLRAAKWSVPQLAVRFRCSSSTIYKRLQKERGRA